MKNKLFIMLLLLIPLAYAFPLQLLPNGSLQEVNYSVNGTSVNVILYNGSLYITNLTNYTMMNITNIYQNITYNITQINQTCLNCTNYYNETINNTWINYNYGYNKSDLDTKFLTIDNFNSYKSGLNYSELVNSNVQIKETSDDWLWISVIGLFLVIAGIIAFIIYKGGE